MWSNWSGLESASPASSSTPSTAAEVQQIVTSARETGRRVKMVGTGHSFTAISAPVDLMLRPDGMRGIIAVDRDAMTATAWAGTQLKVLNAELAEQGLSLHNMGDIAEQTLAGATSTGTHGTGGLAAGLAAQLAGFSLVTGTGELLTATATENPELFAAGRVGLGALGILITVTFRVEPLFALEAVEKPMGWEEFFESFDDLTADAHHVDSYWFPHTDRFATKTNTRLASLDEARPLGRFRGWLDDDFLQNTAFGTLCRITNRWPDLVPRVNRIEAGMLSERTYSDIAHKVFIAERRVVFREMEFAVPRADGLAVLAECRTALEASDLRINFPVELRTAPADDIALSTASDRDSFYLAFHTHRDVDHRPYFAVMEPILRAAQGRPHWGKVHTMTDDDLVKVYPRFTEFLALRDRLDPDRVFANPYLERVLGE